MKVERSDRKTPEKTERRERYAKPNVKSYSSREIVESLGPAQGLMSGASPDVYPGESHSHRGHRH